LRLDTGDYLVVNEIELQTLAGTQIIAGIEETAQTLSRTHKLACIVTLDSEGALCVDSAHVFRVPAMPIKVVDTTGAGDAFIGANLEAAVTRACAAVAIVCFRMGAIPSYPNRAAITHFMKSE